MEPTTLISADVEDVTARQYQRPDKFWVAIWRYEHAGRWFASMPWETREQAELQFPTTTAEKKLAIISP